LRPEQWTARRMAPAETFTSALLSFQLTNVQIHFLSPDKGRSASREVDCKTHDKLCRHKAASSATSLARPLSSPLAISASCVYVRVRVCVCVCVRVCVCVCVSAQKCDGMNLSMEDTTWQGSAVGEDS